VAWFERNFADDFYSISTMTGKLNSKAEEVAEFKTRKEVLESAVASDMDVRVEGNTGIVTGVYRLTGRDEKGQPMDRRIRYTDVYVKRDGRWLVIASQGTLIR
jgi:ketosteroid isomerase-like protein